MELRPARFLEWMATISKPQNQHPAVVVTTAFLITTLSGCAIGLSDPMYKYNSSVLNDENSGVIVGRVLSSNEVGTGITFLRLQDQSEISYLGAKVFCFRLPEGRYAMASIGTRGGAIASEDPFVFEVESGKAFYIGTVGVPGSPVPRGATVKSYGTNWGSKAKPIISGRLMTVFVEDSIGDVLGSFQEDCPGLDSMSLKSRPMQ